MGHSLPKLNLFSSFPREQLWSTEVKAENEGGPFAFFHGFETE